MIVLEGAELRYRLRGAAGFTLVADHQVPDGELWLVAPHERRVVGRIVGLEVDGAGANAGDWLERVRQLLERYR